LIGYVYALSNQAIPGLYKIGRTQKHPRHRAQELFTTGVPAPFDIERFIVAWDCIVAEQVVHDFLSDTRFNEDREFFFCSKAELRDAFILAVELDCEQCAKEATEKDLQFYIRAKEAARKKNKISFNFFTGETIRGK